MALFGIPIAKYNELLNKFETLQKEYNTLRKEYNRVCAENVKLSEENAAQREENAALRVDYDKLSAMTNQIMIEVNDLKEKNAALTERVNMNSSNSSKPPSSDIYKKPTPKSLRKTSGKKPGGQEGHKGHGLNVTRTPDKTVRHIPEKCKTCPNATVCQGDEKTVRTSRIFDVVIDTRLTEHQVIQKACPMMDGKTITAEMPAGITGTVQYGEGICALVTTLYTRGVMSFGRIAEFMEGAFNIPISEGTISNILLNCICQLAPVMPGIKDELIQSDVIHNDETGIRVDTKNHWAHVASNEFYTYITVSEKRGQIGMDEAGILPVYNNTSVHDCYGSYFKYESVRHGLCNDHVLRELQGVTDNQKQPWAEKLSALFRDMEKIKNTDTAKGLTCPSLETLESVHELYDVILDRAKIENALAEPEVRGKKVKTVKSDKAAALIKRLEKYKEGFCLFFDDYTVPRSNNQAERDFRMFKVKQKVSGGFRTIFGCEDYACLMSFISTAKKHGANAYTAILSAFQGRAMEAVFPNSLPNE